MCLIHNKELIWNGQCSFCPDCYTKDKKYAAFVEEFSEEEKQKKFNKES